MSMENGIATSLKLKLGDTVTFDIADTTVTTAVRSRETRNNRSRRRSRRTNAMPWSVLTTRAGAAIGTARAP